MAQILELFFWSRMIVIFACIVPPDEFWKDRSQGKIIFLLIVFLHLTHVCFVELIKKQKTKIWYRIITSDPLVICDFIIDL